LQGFATTPASARTGRPGLTYATRHFPMIVKDFVIAKTFRAARISFVMIKVFTIMAMRWAVLK
jgi:spore maturation protein SpmB